MPVTRRLYLWPIPADAKPDDKVDVRDYPPPGYCFYCDRRHLPYEVCPKRCP